MVSSHLFSLSLVKFLAISFITSIVSPVHHQFLHYALCYIFHTNLTVDLFGTLVLILILIVLKVSRNLHLEYVLSSGILTMTVTLKFSILSPYPLDKQFLNLLFPLNLWMVSFFFYMVFYGLNILFQDLPDTTILTTSRFLFAVHLLPFTLSFLLLLSGILYLMKLNPVTQFQF